MTDNENKKHHISIRCDDHFKEFLDSQSDEWGMSRSKTIRTIIKSYMGLLEGDFFTIINNSDLSEWGEFGKILKQISEDPPESAKDIHLSEIVDLRILLGAEEVELHDETIEKGD